MTRDQLRQVERTLADKVICRRCGATLATMDQDCSAGLDVACDGFATIELVLYPDGGTLDGLATPDQIAHCRAVVEAPC